MKTFSTVAILVLLGTVIKRTHACTDECVPNTCENNPIRDCSCLESRLNGSSTGFYAAIQPDPNQPAFQVFCDNLNGNGKLWTRIQHRIASNEPELGSEGFNRDFTEYENGFGDLSGNHWTGLKNIAALTNAAEMSLRLDHYRDGDFELATGQYRVVRVSGAAKNYRLLLAGFSGNASRSMKQDSNLQPFSARDQDQSGAGCADSYKAGWWYSDACATCTPNGPYGDDDDDIVMGCDVDGDGRTAAGTVSIYVTPEDYINVEAVTTEQGDCSSPFCQCQICDQF